MAFLAPQLGDPENVGCRWPQRAHQPAAEGINYGADIHCRSTCSSLQPAEENQPSQGYPRMQELETRFGNFKHRSLIKPTISFARTAYWHVPYPAIIWRVQAKQQGCTLAMAKMTAEPLGGGGHQEASIPLNYINLSLSLQHNYSQKVFPREKTFCRISASVPCSFGFSHMQEWKISVTDQILQIEMQLLGRPPVLSGEGRGSILLVQPPQSHWPCS